MECPKAALFDLDDTLAPPHAPISDAIAQKIKALCDRIPVGVVSAAPFARMIRDVIRQLPPDIRINNFYVFADNGAHVRIWDNSEWRSVYLRTISVDQKTQLRKAVLKAIQESGVLADAPVTGQRIVERDAGISVAALGTDAPEQQRTNWDPDGKKLELLRTTIEKALPDWNVSSGSLTSVDISPKHISKAAAVWWLADHVHVPPAAILYVGVAHNSGSNDHPVMATGVTSRQTKNVAETLSIMDEILTACAAATPPSIA